jgi:hypothetical protein
MSSGLPTRRAGKEPLRRWLVGDVDAFAIGSSTEPKRAYREVSGENAVF